MSARPLLAALALVACAPLPEPIYASQVRAVFGGEDAALIDAADRCAARLNGLVRSARVSGAVRSAVSGTGALVGGTGAALTALPDGGAEARDAGFGLTVGGAALGLLGTFVASITGEPAELLARHARGLRGWDAARAALEPAGAGVGAAREALERCTRDEAPARAALPTPDRAPGPL